MKKVLFSSVCAVALLGTNVYAVENSLSNSLETFLSQKTKLESKIKEQNTLITQKQESVNNADTNYKEKDKAFKETEKVIITAILTAGDKESEKNKAEREHANLVNQGNSLNIQKENLNSEISELESNITKYEEELKVLETKLNEAKTNQEEKGKLYKTANDELILANANKQTLVKTEEDLGNEHLALQEKYNSAGEEEKNF